MNDLLHAGLAVTEIRNHTRYSQGQIKGVKQRLPNDRGMAHRPDSGRTRKKSGKSLFHPGDLARQWCWKTMAQSLEQIYPDEAVCNRTVRRILHHDLHIKYGKLGRKFKLTNIVSCGLYCTRKTAGNKPCCWTSHALTPNSVRCWYPDTNQASLKLSSIRRSWICSDDFVGQHWSSPRQGKHGLLNGKSQL